MSLVSGKFNHRSPWTSLIGLGTPDLSFLYDLSCFFRLGVNRACYLLVFSVVFPFVCLGDAESDFYNNVADIAAELRTLRSDALAGDVFDIYGAMWKASEFTDLMLKLDAIEDDTYSILGHNRDIASDIYVIKNVLKWYPYTSSPIVGISPAVSQVTGLRDGFYNIEMWLRYLLASQRTQISQGNYTSTITEAVKQSSLLESVTNKLQQLIDKPVVSSADMNIVTQMFVLSTYTLGNARGYNYDDLLGWVEDGDFAGMFGEISPNMWPQFLASCLFPRGSSIAQSLYKRNGEYNAVNRFFPLMVGDTLAIAYYDLYGTGEIYALMTNSLSTARVNTPYVRTRTNTLAFSSEFIGEVKTAGSQMGQDLYDTVEDIQTNAVSEVEDEDVEGFKDSATSSVVQNSIKHGLNTLSQSLNNSLTQTKNAITSSGNDLLLEMNLDLVFPNEVRVSTEGAAIINVSEKLRTKQSDINKLRRIFDFIAWGIRLGFGVFFTRKVLHTFFTFV